MCLLLTFVGLRLVVIAVVAATAAASLQRATAAPARPASFQHRHRISRRKSIGGSGDSVVGVVRKFRQPHRQRSVVAFVAAAAADHNERRIRNGDNDNDNDNGDRALASSSAAVSSTTSTRSSRRDAVRAIMLLTTATTLTIASSPSYAAAVVGEESGASAAASSSSLLTTFLQGLRSIPTFCIVDANTGAAYMLYKRGEGFARGYAFVTYDGAVAVLDDAQRTAEKGGYAETWQNATVTTIPADIAVRLTLQPKDRTSQKGQTASSILALIPGANEREAGIQIDKDKFYDQGKVPIFYFDALRLPDGSVPLYFTARDLIEEWKKQNGDKAVPPRIQAAELVTMFQLVLRGRVDELPPAIRAAQNKIVFIPNSESVQKAKELKAKGLAPYKPDQMVV